MPHTLTDMEEHPGASDLAGVRGRGAPSADLGEWFEEATLPLAPTVYAAAVALTNDPAEAEDLVVRTYALAYRNRRTARAEDLRQWMLLKLTRSYNSHLPSGHSGSIEVAVRQAGFPSDGPGQDLFGGDIRASTRALEAASCADVRAALQSLPTGLRLVLWLANGEGLSHRDIAAIIGVTEEMAGSATHLARSVFCRRLFPRLGGTRSPQRTDPITWMLPEEEMA